MTTALNESISDAKWLACDLWIALVLHRACGFDGLFWDNDEMFIVLSALSSKPEERKYG